MGIFFSISVSCNLIGLFLCLTVGLIQQLQALKCSQQTTEKKNRQEIPWQYCQRTRSGKKISSGDGRGFDLTIPKDKLEFRGRIDKWAHFFFSKGLRSDNSQRQTWVQKTNRGTIPKDKLEHKQVDSTFRQVSTVFFGAVPKCWKYHKTLRFFSTERANEGSSLAADHGRKFNSNRKWVDVEYDWNFGLENQMKRKRIRTESGWM